MAQFTNSLKMQVIKKILNNKKAQRIVLKIVIKNLLKSIGVGNLALATLTFLSNFLLNADVANADNLEDSNIEEMLADDSFLHIFLDLFSD